MILSPKHMAVLCLTFIILGVVAVWTLNGVLSVVSPVESEEDALEISKNSTFVQRELAGARKYNVEVEYLNITEIAEFKEQAADTGYYDSLPDDHGVWRVTWDFYPKEYVPFLVRIAHWIDEETGEILLEDCIVFR